MIFAAQSLYLPLNRLLTGGTLLKIPLDDLIPLRPEWAVVYLLWIPGWLFCYTYATWKMDDRLFRKFFTATLAVILTSMVFYVVFPTYVERPTITGSGWAADLLRFVYRSDGLYNAFPSGHIYITTLVALFYSRWFPRSWWAWVIIVIMMSLSTLFTGQHYALDPLGGIAVAVLGYLFASWITELDDGRQTARTARRRHTPRKTTAA